MLLNNDIELFPRYIQRTQHFPDKNIGVVGGKVLYPNFTIQDCGSILKGFYPISRFRGELADAEESERSDEVNHVSGYFLLTRRSLFKAISPTQQLYGKGYFEETEYCMRVSQKNLKVIIEPNSILVHNNLRPFQRRDQRSLTSSFTKITYYLATRYLKHSIQMFPKKNTLCIISENVNDFDRAYPKQRVSKSNSKILYGLIYRLRTLNFHHS